MKSRFFNTLQALRSVLLRTPPWVMNLLSLGLMFLTGRITCMLSHLPWGTDGLPLLWGLFSGNPAAFATVLLSLIPVSFAVYFSYTARKLQRAAILRELNMPS